MDTDGLEWAWSGMIPPLAVACSGLSIVMNERVNSSRSKRILAHIALNDARWFGDFRSKAVESPAWVHRRLSGCWWQASLACLVAVLVTMLRRPDAFLNPQFWAEDGPVFFLGNELAGWRAIFQGYAGYLHLIPRLTAWFGTPFAPTYSPAFFNAAAVACLLFVVGRMFSPRLHLPGKLWLALAIVLVPQTGEVTVNITNIQWYTVFLLIQLLLMSDAASGFELVGDAVIAILAGLTGPFSILLAPLFAWRSWQRRTWWSHVLLCIILGCAAVQAWFILHFPATMNTTPLAGVPLAAVVGRRTILLLLFGYDLQQSTGLWLSALTGSALLAACVTISLLRAKLRREKLMLWICFALLLAAAVLRSRMDQWNVSDFGAGDRYLFAPRVILVWLLIVEFNFTRRLWLVGGLSAAMLVANAAHFRLPPLADCHWRDYTEAIREGKAVAVPINPGWTLQVPAHAQTGGR